MIKTVAKILITTLFITLTVYFSKQDRRDSAWGSYTPIIFNTVQDADRGIELLKELGFKDIISKNNVKIGINDFFVIKESSFEDIDNRLDKKDYRYDPYILSVASLFSSSDPADSIVYIKLSSSDLMLLYNMYHSFSTNAILYKIGNPLFLRIILNYICFISILLLFSVGCKTRFIVSIISGVLAFFFMDPASVYSFISFTVGYFLVIMIVESFSFSNKYIKRNNVGLIRIMVFLVLFSTPTFIPGFLDFSKAIYTPVSQNDYEFDYSSLEKLYDEQSPTISNYFTHYAFQKSFLYGYKYLFPTYKNSVTIDEFNREDYYLSRYVKIVEEYDEDFFEDFISYCGTTVLGRFYLDYGRPFSLELNSLLSLYIVEKEYMQIGMLSVIMLISSLFFKKSGDKKLKY